MVSRKGFQSLFAMKKFRTRIFFVPNTRRIQLKIVAMIARPKYHVILLNDVSWLADKHNMAEAREKVKTGGRYCVAGAPNNESCKNTSYTKGVSMHTFPTEPTLKAKWIKFVQKHRVDFGETVSKFAALCSAHFEKECFDNYIAWSLGYAKRRNLVSDTIPTRHTTIPEGPEVLSERQKRQVSKHSVFNVIAFVFTCRRHMYAIIQDGCIFALVNNFIETLGIPKILTDLIKISTQNLSYAI